MNPKPHLLCFLAIFSVNSVHAQSKAPWVGTNLIGIPCIGGVQGYGPFDYLQRKSIDPSHLSIVEAGHFTSKVEGLIAGNSDSIEGDLDYTLRAWPNHHRALLSIARYQFKINSKLAKGKLITPPECYFQRAINFSPKDAVTASLYGYYLRETRHFKDAALAYEEALKLAPNTAKIEYAYSLLLIDLKQYDNALIQAKNAYQHGRPPQGLKNILIKLGVWK